MEIERMNVDLFDSTIDKTEDMNNMLKSKFQDKAGIYDSNATVVKNVNDTEENYTSKLA